MTDEQFAEGFAILVQAFPTHEVPHETQNVWFRMLEPLPADLFFRGVEKVIATHRYNTFPTVAQVLDILDEDGRFYSPHAALSPREKLKRYEREHRERKLLAGGDGRKLGGDKRNAILLQKDVT